MPHELIVSLDTCLRICFLCSICYPIIKGYIAESKEYTKHCQYNNDFETQTDIDTEEAMNLVNLFTVLFFIFSFLTLCFYGRNQESPVDEVVMQMFLSATVLYFGRDIVWILLGLLWFIGAGAHVLLIELHTPKTNDT